MLPPGMKAMLLPVRNSHSLRAVPPPLVDTSARPETDSCISWRVKGM